MFTRTLQQRFSRQDAKTAKKTFLILLLGALCAFARVILYPILPLFSELGVLCEMPSLSDSLNPNSTENFKYLWIVFVCHEAHEDHEEFTIKLYRPLRFKPRGRYNLIDYRLMTPIRN